MKWLAFLFIAATAWAGPSVYTYDPAAAGNVAGRDASVWSSMQSGGMASGMLAAWQFEEATDRFAATYTNSVSTSANVLTNLGTGVTFKQLVTNGVSGSSIFLNVNDFIPWIADNASVGLGAGKSFTLAGWYRRNELDNTASYGRGIFSKWDPTDTTLQDYLCAVVTNVVIFHARDLAGTEHTVTSKVLIGFNMWYHVAVGYDGSAQRIWIQVNGEARQTTACVGVKRTTVDFVLAGLSKSTNSAQTSDGGTTPARDLDEVYLWGRSLAESEIQSLLANFYPFSKPLRTLGQFATSNWVAQVIVNGGTAPSATISNALMAFIDGGVVDGYYGAISSWNFFCTNDLTTALTPFNGILASQYYRTRNGNAATYWPNGPFVNPWVNHGFLAADLTKFGLTNGTTKWIGTGVTPTWRFDGIGSSAGVFNNSSSGISVYTTGGGDGGGFDTGTIDDSFVAASALAAGVRVNTGGIFYCYGFGASSVGQVYGTPNGFYSTARVSRSDSRVYFANSTNTFAQVGTTVTGNDTADVLTLTRQMVVFNADDSRLSWPNRESISFVAYHPGFSLTTGSNFFNRVQALKTITGGIN